MSGSVIATTAQQCGDDIEQTGREHRRLQRLDQRHEFSQCFQSLFGLA
jgi:hypothetical protein